MAVSQIATVFKLDRNGLRVAMGVSIMAVMVLPLIVLTALDLEDYWVSLVFGVLFVWISDPGGDYAFRVREMAVVGVLGTLLTALGYGIGGEAWGLVVLAALVVTLLAGLAVKYGLHRFVAAYLLNVWFLVALALPVGFRLDHVQTSLWGQALAWLIGSALAIAYTAIRWLVAGRTAQPAPIPEIPGSAGQADPAADPVRGDPGRCGGDHGRDRLRAAPAERGLDAHRRPGRHEVQPGAIHPGRGAAAGRGDHRRRGGRRVRADR
jgi:hypothetical protein